MSAGEWLQRTFWEGYAANSLQIADIAICLCAVIVLSAYIFFVYRMLCGKAFYNKNFNLSLIALAIIVSAIILTIQTNIVISLGMVGALSIVRYRTAVKDAMDLVFLFWAISVGIICGAGFALIAVVASIVLSIVLFIFSKISKPKSGQVLLVNSSDYAGEESILQVVEDCCKVCTVRSRSLTKDHLDMAIEVCTNEQGEMLRKLMELENVVSASLVDHDGDVTL